ncbi:Cutinase transcription factor 1 alpha [Colletotrichum gloeosporioides]|uniref:Cutinase transcription factor 1 alpha n=1 Tax=Colletotrichum gloeosporioides TaxID=474922 RepID=A0A8H4CWW4_COLGL|nr:Cutinase transcription factor 1 alpha [Colletotrichum gloeosporioides]KAF3811492.1 Cutinase transcription factor 1 alpha [Colletotrichum gloeosporioides]
MAVLQWPLAPDFEVDGEIEVPAVVFGTGLIGLDINLDSKSILETGVIDDIDVGPNNAAVDADAEAEAEAEAEVDQGADTAESWLLTETTTNSSGLDEAQLQRHQRQHRQQHQQQHEAAPAPAASREGKHSGAAPSSPALAPATPAPALALTPALFAPLSDNDNGSADPSAADPLVSLLQLDPLISAPPVGLAGSSSAAWHIPNPNSNPSTSNSTSSCSIHPEETSLPAPPLHSHPHPHPHPHLLHHHNQSQLYQNQLRQHHPGLLQNHLPQRPRHYAHQLQNQHYPYPAQHHYHRPPQPLPVHVQHRQSSQLQPQSQSQSKFQHQALEALRPPSTPTHPVPLLQPADPAAPGPLQLLGPVPEAERAALLPLLFPPGPPAPAPASASAPITSRPAKFVDELPHNSPDPVASPANRSPDQDESIMDVDMSSADLAAQNLQRPQQSTPQKSDSPSQAGGTSNVANTSPNPQSGSSASASASAAAAAAAAAANHMSFRRQRASRACEVRCDAASLGVPCTNCVAFQIECRIPTPKRKKTTNAGTSKDSDRSAPASPLPSAPSTGLTELLSSEKGDNAEDRSPRAASTAAPGTFPPRTPAVYHTTDGTPSSTYTESQARKEEIDSGTYLNLVMKPKFTRAPITDAGRVAYLGESSNLTLLVHDRQGSSDVVHYPLPENVRGSRARLTELDNVEIDILHQRGAFLLPPRSLCDELIDSYFKWVHPIVPVINRTRFMRQYRDPKNPPSLLLLQAVLLAGSRVCTNPQLMDANGSTTPAALTFYKRAKALYDANYEDDRVTIVQSLLLMGWYWEGPEDVTKNVFYWSRVATIVAQGSGMHRSVEQSQLSRSDKRLWKRIWWTLFTRDRSVAVALGRPVHINLDDSDVEMLTEDDFIEDEGDRNSEYPPDPIHVQFFMQYVKLCEIMGLVLSQQYSVASKGRQRNAIDLTHSDMALADWLQNCPKLVYWEVARHHFWSALLHSNYYTTLCLLHRAHMPPNGGSRFPDDAPYPSRNIAFQAAAMITSIIENLAAHGELRFCPAFVVYSLFSALIMHVYQMRSPVPSIQQVTQDRLRTCMQALKEVSRVWLVGKMVYTLFESIIGNKVLEERLQKAAGKRHRKAQQTLAQLEQQQQRPQEAAKRKYDDMAIDFSVNTPTPQESYERSRPQTPSHMKGDGSSNSQTMPPPTSPNSRQNADTFMGGTSSRPQTRPATPFNPSFSVPATPPDLYLVTRNSPNISQSLWENFQPDQLFPDSASMPAFPQMSPSVPNQSGIDAGLMAQLQNPNLQGGLSSQNSQFQQRAATKAGLGGSPPQGHNVVPGLQGFQQQQQQGHGQNNSNLNSSLWTANFDGLMPDGHSPSDSWSTGSAQGQPVPNTLNVEDWFQFFGINNGDLANMNIDLGLGPQ